MCEDELGVCLPEAALDTITNITFHSRRSSLFLSTSWDGTVSIYNCDDVCNRDDKRPITTLKHSSPVTSACFVDRTAACDVVFVGGCHRQLVMYDLHVASGGTAMPLGQHTGGITHVAYSHYNDVVVTAGLDHSVKVWDARLPYDHPVGWVTHPGLVCATATQGPLLVAAFRSKNRAMVWDLRQLKWRLPLQRRSLLIRSDPICSIDIAADCLSFAYASEGGRFAVESLIPPTGSGGGGVGNKFVAIGHRPEVAKADKLGLAVAYPIHALCYYKPVAGSRGRATGSGDRATGSGDRATGSGDRATGSGDRATGSGDRATGSRDRATGRATGSGDRATGSRDRATGSGDRATGSGDRATGSTGRATGSGDRATGSTGRATGSGDRATGITGSRELLVTGGAEGTVKVWDTVTRKCVVQVRNYPSSISCARFSPGGDHLVVASSGYGAAGIKSKDLTTDHQRHHIYIKPVSELVP